MANKNDGASIVLKINDVVVPMNHFVESVFINVIDGLVETLDKIPKVKNKIEVLIEKN